MSIVQGFDVKRMDMDSVSKTWRAIENMNKALCGEGRYTVTGATTELLAETARLKGIPATNFKREIMSILSTTFIEHDMYLAQYYVDSFFKNVGYSGNTQNFMSILYNASKNDREAYRIIYDDMVEKDLMATSGKSTEEKIKDAVGGRYMDDLYYAYVSAGDKM